MKSTITNAADITVLAPIDATEKTGGGPVSVGATVVQAPRGQPNTVLRVTARNWQDVLGMPYHSKTGGVKMEGLRHLADALRDCDYVNVVRVLAEDAQYPSITMDNAGLITKAAHSYPVAPIPADLLALSIWVVDGDPSTSRSVNITDVDEENARFQITFQDIDVNGEPYVLESYKCGIAPTDLDDMGLPAFIETVLENNGSRFRCDFNESVTFAEFATAVAAGFVTAQAFTGGTNGAEPVTLDWTTAWDIFRNESIAADIMFAAGNLDAEVLANCIEIAEARHCSFVMDASPALKHDAAIAWLSGAGMSGRQAAVYHAPIKAADKFYGGKTVWGVSGEMAAAIARCNAIYTGSVPGVHYSPAGEARARMQRTGIEMIYPDDELDRDALYTARINPIIVSPYGGAVCDDALSLHHKESYLRFIWVNRILNYIDHRWYQGASAIKFEPDGITEEKLYRMGKDILDDLVTSGALVPPRDPAFGTEPYIYTVEQLEIDLWRAVWEVCPTGAARRIVGQPKLIR